MTKQQVDALMRSYTGKITKLPPEKGGGTDHYRDTILGSLNTGDYLMVAPLAEPDPMTVSEREERRVS